MKIFKNFIGLAALALCLGFASCSSDDDAPSYSNVAVSNSELMTILKAKGYQFDENGKMLFDDKANSTTSLDLSGTKVDTAALKELSVFPNLKDGSFHHIILNFGCYQAVEVIDVIALQVKTCNL